MKRLKEYQSNSPFLHFVDFVKCTGKSHLESYLKEITESNGEGVMLRKPLSNYEIGRSDSLCKYKLYVDTEVKVIEKTAFGIKCSQYVILYIIT